MRLWTGHTGRLVQHWFIKRHPGHGCLRCAQVQLEEGEGGDQRVRLWTGHPGRLVLHWGVEGGRDYRGGWRLPGREAWPEGTVQYKERALQTPWRCALLVEVLLLAPDFVSSQAHAWEAAC